jgi:hypothetical protein
MNAGDLDGVEALMHPDFYEDYPQSGERIRGAANARAEVENYPGGLKNQLIKDNLLYRQTTFFAEPFDPPEWRAPYAERIPG